MSEILFADDDDLTREMISAALESGGHSVRVVTNGSRALEEVRRLPPDLVLLDYRMGSPNGFEVCRRIKDTPWLRHIPVLILTGEGALEDRLSGFDAGADDYLAKPVDHRELLARVHALVQLARRGLERNPSSGLPGGETIDSEWERRRALAEPVSVCYLDLDFFKPFGERFGFRITDALIRDIGDILRSLTGGSDAFAGHVGGDDFIVICRPDEARPIAEAVQERFQRRVAVHLPPEVVERGRYDGVDRGGTQREFPLTRMSVAIIHVEADVWESLSAFGTQVSVVKRLAKEDATSGIAEVDLTAS